MAKPMTKLEPGALYKLDREPMYWMYVGFTQFSDELTCCFRGTDGGTIHLLPDRAQELLGTRNLTAPEDRGRIQKLEQQNESLKRENKTMIKLLKQAEKMLMQECEI